jgi:hypothetical protein
MMFKPEKLDKNHAFKFEEPYNITFEEFNVKSTDRVLPNGLLFISENPKV